MKKIVLCLVAFSNLTLLTVGAVRPNDGERRLKGSGVSNRPRDRRLLGQDEGNTGLLGTFDRVWMDATSVKTETLVSKCVKPEKKKGNSTKKKGQKKGPKTCKGENEQGGGGQQEGGGGGQQEGGGNGGQGGGNGGQQNESPVAAPTVATAPTALAPDGSTVVAAQQSVCDAFAAGKAPTTAPRQNFAVSIALNIDQGANETTIFQQMGKILRGNIAPMLLKCGSGRRRGLRRQLQGNATEYVNLVFTDPARNTTANCTAASGVCVPSIIKSDLYYYGDAPVGFGDSLRQAILYWPFNINGLNGFGDIQVAQGDGGSSNGVVPSDVAPTPGPVDRGAPPLVASQQSESGRGGSPGAFVAAAVAALTLVLVALFVVRRSRSSSSDSLSKHREFTNDEDDLGNETDENTANTPPRKSRIVGDGSLDDSWNSGYTASGRQLQYEGYKTRLQDFQQEPHHECGSATCEACAIDRERGTQFVLADLGMGPTMQNLPPRVYAADDTVNL